MTSIAKAEEFVVKLFNTKLSKLYNYHNLLHTLSVVKAVNKISKNYNLDILAKEKLLFAAWFHDTGYITGSLNHEEKSKEIVTEFLMLNNFDINFIQDVTNIINVTKFNINPTTDLQKIMKDADYFHFGSKNYFKTSELLRKEWEDTDKKTFTDLQWMESNLSMFVDFHQYYTPYAKENLQPQKDKNKELIIKKIKKLKNGSKH